RLSHRDVERIRSQADSFCSVIAFQSVPDHQRDGLAYPSGDPHSAGSYLHGFRSSADVGAHSSDSYAQADQGAAHPAPARDAAAFGARGAPAPGKIKRRSIAGKIVAAVASHEGPEVCTA